MSEPYSNIGEVEIANLGLGCGIPTRQADIQRGMTVLDLGSGAGIDAFIAAKEVGPTGTVIGLDMTEKMIERAMENKKKLNIQNIEFRLGEIEHMPVESNSIDRIISNCVINLVPDKRQAFSEMYRVLKQGGRFIISDIVSTGTMPDDIKKNAEQWAGCVAGAINKNDYLQQLTNIGFTNVQVLKEKRYSDISTDEFGLFSITIQGTK
jgi:ubiquinone/menaquinone biosynthesis C-methylase UbiE